MVIRIVFISSRLTKVCRGSLTYGGGGEEEEGKRGGGMELQNKDGSKFYQCL